MFTVRVVTSSLVLRMTHIRTHAHANTQTQTDRQTDRQTHAHTHTHTHTHTKGRKFGLSALHWPRSKLLATVRLAGSFGLNN